jgi:hypothetical protein
MKCSWLVSECVSRRVAVAEAGDSSGTQSKGNVRGWKPLPSNGQGRLRRHYVCCGYSDLWSVKLGETVVVICSYVL